MAQLNLYYRTQLETKVSLLAEQIDGSIDDHILENLKAKIEGKTIDNGIVLKINRLINYDYGIIDKTNFMSSTVIKVKYECFLCSPTKDLEIVCVLENNIKGYLICKNGPVTLVVQFNNIDSRNFSRNGNEVIYTKTGKAIKKGDYLKVSVVNVSNNLGEKTMVVMCKLINLANKDEIQSYEKDQLLVTDHDDEDNKEFI